MSSDGEPPSGNAPDESVEYFVAHHEEIVHGAGRTRLVAAWLFLILLVLLTLLAISGAIGAARAAEASSRIQRHGIRVSATVQSVHTATHRYVFQGSRSSFGSTTSWYHSVLTVNLHEPVDGRSTVAIGSNENAPARVGQTLEVLIDPSHPGFGELPGQPIESHGDFVRLAGLAAVLLVLDGYTGIKLVRARRQHPRKAPS